MVSTWITPLAAKGLPSSIAGRGLVAVRAISAGEVVAVKGGHVVSTDAVNELPDPLPNSAVQITDDLHLVALSPDEYEAVMLFLNHSCDPNVGVAGNVVLVAMRDISVGEELTTDYAMFDDHDGHMDCACGAPQCRGTIDGRDWRRRDLQDRYAGYFSWYLQRRISDLRGSAGDPPYVDVHHTRIPASREVVWTALGHYVDSHLGVGGRNPLSWLLGAEPRTGFEVTREVPGELLRMAGRHRFSRHLLVFELADASDGETMLSARTYAAFPGMHGRVYRALVIGTRGHVVATRHMLRAVRRLSRG